MELKPKRKRRRYRYALAVVALLLQSCMWVEVERLGSGFFFLVWVTEGMGHTGRDRDLYYRSVVGIPRLIHKDVTGADVSPSGDKVLFYTWGNDPGNNVLHLFDRTSGETIRIAEGSFYVPYGSDYWSPKGDRFVYQTGPIFLFDVTTRQTVQLLGRSYVFLSWSPSGERIAYMTAGSVYEVNELSYMVVETGAVSEVARKEGLWRVDDFEWRTVDGGETIAVKN